MEARFCSTQPPGIRISAARESSFMELSMLSAKTFPGDSGAANMGLYYRFQSDFNRIQPERIDFHVCVLMTDL